MTRQELHCEFNKAGSLLFSLNIHDGIKSVTVRWCGPVDVDVDLEYSKFKACFAGHDARYYRYNDATRYELIHEGVRFIAYEHHDEAKVATEGKVTLS